MDKIERDRRARLRQREANRVKAKYSDSPPAAIATVLRYLGLVEGGAPYEKKRQRKRRQASQRRNR